MGAGFAFALNEITLVLFTTLAPSGAVAFVLMGLPLFRKQVQADERARVNQFLFIPLVVTMLGLVASATHLGNPDNALYVLAGVGRSPLSTEVVCAVAFLALAGVYWLLTFWPRFGLAAQRAWFAVASLAAVVFVSTVAFAYDQPTIITWNLWEVSVALWLNALVGGPVLALAGRIAAGIVPEKRETLTFVLVAAVAVVANGIVYLLQGIDLMGLRNAVGSAFDLVPGYGFAVVAFVVLCAAGILLDARTLLANGRGRGGFQLAARKRAGAPASQAKGNDELQEATDPLSEDFLPAFPASLIPVTCASLLVFAGIFVMRFVFYMTHLTVGISM